MKQTTYVKKNKWIHFVYLVLFVGLFVLIANAYFDSSKETESNQTANNSDEGLLLTKGAKNLPILVIDTNGQTIEANTEEKEIEVNGVPRKVNQASERYTVDLKLYEPGVTGQTVIDSKAVPTMASKVVMNVRGQSSLRYKKQSYTIRLVDEYGLKNPQEFLGMASHDKWVLNGLYSDKSLMRNAIAYKMGRDTMAYAPDTRYVEVYLKNTETALNDAEHYVGVYLLTEKIERDRNRVDIDKNSEKYQDISFIFSRDKIKYGDVLLRSDWNRLEEDFIVDENNVRRAGTVFTTTYPSNDNMTEEFKTAITDYINEFEYALRSNHFDNPRTGYRKYIDVDSFINFAMINEVTKNVDGGEVSAYFHKDLGGLMTAGPIWDFDQSLGNTRLEELNEPTGFRIVNVIWYERLFQDQYFVERYKSMYRNYRNTIWSNQNIDSLIDEQLLVLGSSVQRNQEKWYPQDTQEDQDKEIEKVRTFLKERLTWMDKNIDSMDRIKQNPEK